MTKRRSLDGHIRASENFSKLTYRQRDLWHGLIVSVDDQGRIPGSPAFIRSTIWPYDDLPLSEVETDLKVLEGQGSILRYSVNGCKYIQLVNWHKYQSHAEWLGLSDYPAPDGWIDHARYHTTGNLIATLNWTDRTTTMKAGSPLPSRDVKDEGKDEDEGNDEDDGENAARDAFDDMQQLVTSITGHPANPTRDIQPIKDMVKNGITESDLREAMTFLSGKKKVYGAADMAPSAQVAHSRRVQGKHKPPNPDDANFRASYADGIPAQDPDWMTEQDVEMNQSSQPVHN
jgi:hypothetical protein